MPGRPDNGGGGGSVGPNTPGAIAYTEYGGRSGTVPYTAYRMPTEAEQAARDLRSQMQTLSPEIQAKLASGELTSQYTTVANGLGRNGDHTSNNGISEFTSQGPNDTTIHYDLNGKQTAITQNEHGGGWLDHAMGALGGGVQHISDVVSSDPIAQAAVLAVLAVATGGASALVDMVSAVPELASALPEIAATAPEVAAVIPEVASAVPEVASALASAAPEVTAAITATAPEIAAEAGLGSLGAAGSSLSGEALLGSELAAYPTAGIVGTIPEAAGLGSLGVTGLESAIDSLPAYDQYIPTDAPGLPSLPAYDQYIPPNTPGLPDIPAYDQYIPPETVSTPPSIPNTQGLPSLSDVPTYDQYVPPDAPGLPSLPAYDQYIPPDAPGLPDVPAYDQYVPPETVKTPPSINEMVASGTGPGSAGAQGAANGTLTGDALNAASGVGTAASTLTAAQVIQGIKDAKAAADALKLLGIGAGGAAVVKSLTSGGGNSGYQGTVPKYTASRTQKSASETRAGVDGKPYRPGQGGVTYFSPMVYTPAAAKGGLMGLAGGGEIGNEAPQFNISLNTDQGSNYPVQGYPSREDGVEQNGITQSSLPQTSGLQSLYGPSMQNFNNGGAVPGQYGLGSYSDGGRLLKGPGDGVSDSIPAIIGEKQPARLATGEFVIPARIVSELGNGSTEAGAQRLYEMMDRIQKTRRKTKNVAANTNAAKYLPA